MNKSSVMIRTIVEVALFAALGFVFDELQGAVAKAIFPTGGSIGFAIIAVVIISFRRGPIAGFATGLSTQEFCAADLPCRYFRAGQFARTLQGNFLAYE